MMDETDGGGAAVVKTKEQKKQYEKENSTPNEFIPSQPRKNHFSESSDVVFPYP